MTFGYAELPRRDAVERIALSGEALGGLPPFQGRCLKATPHAADPGEGKAEERGGRTVEISTGGRREEGFQSDVCSNGDSEMVFQMLFRVLVSLWVLSLSSIRRTCSCGIACAGDLRD